MNYFRNYNRILWAFSLAILAALVIFLIWNLYHRMARELLVIESQAERHHDWLEYVLRSSVDQIQSLRMSADLDPNGMFEKQPAFKIPGYIKPIAGQLGFTADAITNPDAGGNWMGWQSLDRHKKDLMRELQRAKGLDSSLRSLQFNLPSAVQSRYISVQDFVLSSPWKESSKQTWGASVYQSEVWLSGQKQSNPLRQPVWGKSFYGGDDLGLLLPLTVPVDDANRWVGVAEIDIALDDLNRKNSEFSYPLGVTMMVDAHENILAHPQAYANPLKVSQMPLWHQVNPAEISLQSIVSMPAHRVHLLGEWYVWHQPFDAAPFEMIYLLRRADLLKALAVEQGPALLAIMIGMLSLMWFSNYLTRREFAGPAALLVEHIERISLEKNSDATRPDESSRVPRAWQPMFERTGQAFSAAREYAGLQQELKIAAELQQAILPRNWPKDQRFTLYGAMRPAKAVGGDFHDHLQLSQDVLSVSVADVSGKGVAAALFAMVSKTELRGASQDHALQIQQTLHVANKQLAQGNDNCMFVTALHAVFDFENQMIGLANAGHLAPICIHADGQIEEIHLPANLALGLIDEFDFEVKEYRLAAGERWVLITDGVTEAMNENFEEFGTERLIRVLQQHVQSGCEVIVNAVMQAVADFAQNADPSDDLTCVVFHYHPEAVS